VRSVAESAVGRFAELVCTHLMIWRAKSIWPAVAASLPEPPPQRSHHAPWQVGAAGLAGAQIRTTKLRISKPPILSGPKLWVIPVVGGHSRCGDTRHGKVRDVLTLSPAMQCCDLDACDSILLSLKCLLMSMRHTGQHVHASALKLTQLRSPEVVVGVGPDIAAGIGVWRF
jgi:hypothetical protein